MIAWTARRKRTSTTRQLSRITSSRLIVNCLLCITHVVSSQRAMVPSWSWAQTPMVKLKPWPIREMSYRTLMSSQKTNTILGQQIPQLLKTCQPLPVLQLMKWKTLLKPTPISTSSTAEEAVTTLSLATSSCLRLVPMVSLGLILTPRACKHLNSSPTIMLPKAQARWPLSQSRFKER